MGLPRGSFAAAVLACALVAAPAHAQTVTRPAPGGADPVAKRVVQVIVVGGGREGQRLLDNVTVLLERANLSVEAHAVASPDDASGMARGSAAVRVEVDLRVSDDASLVTEGRGPLVGRRVVPRDPASTVALEEVAQAIESAAESRLLADEEPETAPAVPAVPVLPAAVPEGPASPVPAASPVHPAPVVPGGSSSTDSEADDVPPPEAPWRRPASGLGADVSSLGGAGGVASNTSVVAVLGGEVTVASRRGWRPSLSLLADGVLPFNATGESVSSRTSVFDTRVLGGVAVLRRSWLTIETGAGVGVEVLWSTPQSSVLDSSVLGASSTRAGALVSAFASAHVSPTPSVAITVMVLGDLAIAPARYVVVEGGSTDVVFAPWNLRPTVLAGFTFTALGSPAYARREP